MNVMQATAKSYQDLGSVLSEAKCGVFIINLDRRQDRWDRISKHLNEVNCHSFCRVAAIDGLKESKELAQRVVRLDTEYPSDDKPTNRQMSVLGCLKSHLKALKLVGTFGYG